ncbi:ABC transporter permease [Arvimicrobium flavum]|uniref:ABC transporter permease n=1 Tax=Arvimicrobium flavum TaxID=3393320 RepID=UPI00398D06B8
MDDPHADRRPPAQRLVHPWLLCIAILIAGIVLLPVISLATVALTGSGEDWPHLIRNVLPGATTTTLGLLAMVAVGTAVAGVISAWLVVAFDFPFRRTMSWALVLPLAVPPYLAAYAFAEFFHYSGPVQSLVRAVFGFETIRDYWFPDVRSTGGAALVLTSVLYPYVYLTTRVVLLMQGRNIGDVARTLGARPAKVFLRVLLPVTRPAIIAGVALVLMETINDIGASEYLGVRTLTFAVYSTWLNRGSLEGGAQVALIILVLVFALLMLEQHSRKRQRFHNSRGTQIKAHHPRIPLHGRRGWTALGVTLSPVLLGFGIPLFVFGQYASRRIEQFATPELGAAFLTSVATSAVTAVLTVSLALVLVNAVRVARSGGMTALVRLASVGYALPGGILGLGLILVLTRFDNGLDALMRVEFGVSTGLLVSGSAAAVILGCTIRFLALAEGAVRSGLDKLPPHLDEAARSLGKSPTASATTVLLPLLKPAILTALVLVFVDTVKELSATILLRPFGFGTLATYVYEQASRGAPEDGAAAALVIILTAMAPVILLSGALMRDREASM